MNAALFTVDVFMMVEVKGDGHIESHMKPFYTPGLL